MIAKFHTWSIHVYPIYSSGEDGNMISPCYFDRNRPLPDLFCLYQVCGIRVFSQPLAVWWSFSFFETELRGFSSYPCYLTFKCNLQTNRPHVYLILHLKTCVKNDHANFNVFPPNSGAQFTCPGTAICRCGCIGVTVLRVVARWIWGKRVVNFLLVASCFSGAMYWAGEDHFSHNSGEDGIF